MLTTVWDSALDRAGKGDYSALAARSRRSPRSGVDRYVVRATDPAVLLERCCMTDVGEYLAKASTGPDSGAKPT